MSTLSSAVEQDFPSSSNARDALRFPFWGILFATVVIGMAAVTVLLHRQQQLWVEIVGKDVLRTNAPSEIIATARDVVIQKHQNWIVGDDGKRSDPSYQDLARTWSVGPSPEEPGTTVIRGNTRITDKDSAILSIESISVTDTPTLIFIEFDNPSDQQAVVNELVDEFVKQGANVR